MAVKNIECQIAQGQMSRYLAGDHFSPDLAVELRAHIAECPDCAKALDKRRSVLQAMIESSGSRIAVSAPAASTKLDDSDEETVHSPAGAALMNLLRNRAGTPNAVAKLEAPSKKFWKPLAYSLALGAVLFAMSYVMRDPTKLFGERATSETTTALSSSGAPSEAGTQTASPTSGTESSVASSTIASLYPSEVSESTAKTENDAATSKPSQPVGRTPAPEVKSTPATTGPAANAPDNTIEAKAAASRTFSATSQNPIRKTTHARRNTPARRTRISKAPRQNPAGIRVYDANGNALNR